MAVGASALMMGFAYPPLTIGLSATTVAGSSTSSTVTSTSVTATKSGGSGQVTTTWVYQSGSTAINPTAPNSATTAFQATGMSVGSISAVFKATVRDVVTGETLITGNVTATLERGNPPLTMSQPGDAVATLTSSSTITVSAGTSASASGGVGTITYSFSPTGDFSMSGSGSSRTFSRALAPQGGVVGSCIVTATDGIGQSVSRTFTVVLINNGSAPAPLSVWVDNSSVAAYGSTGSATGGPVSASWSGGVGPFVASWSKVSGSGSVSGSGASATFSANGIPVQGTLDGSFRVTVTDQGTGQQQSAGVSVIFYNFGLG